MTPPSMPLLAHPRQAAGDVNPVLVISSRGSMTESWHRGAFALAGREGLIASSGDIERAIYPRSAYKLLQALPLIETGAADAFHLCDMHLSLAAASHSGEREHVRAVLAWLADIGAGEGNLACGPHAPGNAEAAADLIREGRAPGRAHNNCSGKHAGFLTVARHIGAPLEGYLDIDHPVQRLVRTALAEAAGLRADSLPVGLDGCGAPNFAMPLHALARAYARIASAADDTGPRAHAMARLTKAVRNQPFYVAGTGRLCTRIIGASHALVAKVGAEGVYVAAIPEMRLGLALKIDDGSRPAAESLLCALLVALGVLDPESGVARDFLAQDILNTQGRRTGLRLPETGALSAALGEEAGARIASAVAKASASL